MEVFIIGAVIVFAIGYFIWNEGRNHNEKSSSDVAPVLTQVLDVNKDGKVDSQDIKAAAQKVKAVAKNTASKAKTATKTAAKKAVKKVAAKKTVKK
jgi:hypothetical protein